MFLNLLETLLTPCPRYVRTMGYLREVIGIGVRYRRCKADWQPHLDRSRDWIRQAIARCPSHRKAVILGSGRLYDAPLQDLATAFDEVVLVDLIHPLPARWRCRRLANVQRVSADVTGVLEPLQTIAYAGGTLPTSQPALFLDDSEVDLVVSLNILSQLPIIPERFLRRWLRFTECDIATFGRQLMAAQIAYLQRFGGVMCSIADVAFLTVDADEQIVKEEDALRGLALPWSGAEWIWRLAPRGAGRTKTGYYHRVRGMISA